MEPSPVYQGYVKKYGGFLFKHWKERYILLSHDGSLFISRDLDSPPELEISLLSRCQAVLEGSELEEMLKLPAGAQPDCCLGLSLNDGRKLLLMASDAQECSKWINILRKVKESLSLPPLSPASCSLHPTSPIRRCCWRDVSAQAKDKTQGKEGKMTQYKEKRPTRCLRHSPQPHRGVKTACVLMGEAAAGPTLAYMVTTSYCARSAETVSTPEFREVGYQASSGGSQYDVDFEGMDQDYNAFDFGGFAF
ncbi:uncharacterized protein RCH25_043068 [Pelodytes ibericus]